MYTLSIGQTDYPQSLAGIDGAPQLLYIDGELLEDDGMGVAIVGSRTPSQYGVDIAFQFASQLAQEGITIISGLARGIDSVAHTAALDSGGRTIAVLGSGIDIIYPKQNYSLAKRIMSRGALVSEFSPHTPPLPQNFLWRNRIISGLSQAILVVEGLRRSGTLSTATHAANQGREVFAVPGPINSPLSELPNFLIENGARIATSPADILNYLHNK